MDLVEIRESLKNSERNRFSRKMYSQDFQKTPGIF
jgi:hypothetical protein